METAPFILKKIKPFTLESKVEAVKLFFKETAFSHFPIVNNNELIGLISKIDIDEVDANEKKLEDFSYLINLFFVEQSENLLEIIKAFAANEANIVPVIKKDHTYIGYLDLIDILHVYNQTPFLNNEGVVLQLEKEIQDFSFTQVSQIVETNNGKISGLFISETSGAFVKITLKFSAQDINEIIQAFRRYNYTVLSKHKEDFYLEELKERSDYLQKYLNI
ncbi:CBS domain-containing protein [Lutibacter sp. A80]|uniref:CBS domain-containing protein n=1 Tax=Lutibacter sp. A80 TaxID=2918453 RepID=UPI001F052862|nr:CBS domain-containing protein [Lutibacter sp. A80]UMB59099.1 CBS domain-containing protein [Lutibacter sp. A80]